MTRLEADIGRQQPRMGAPAGAQRPLTGSQGSGGWVALNTLWAAYYVGILTIGRYEGWTQPVIWIGAAIVIAATLRSLASRLATIPSETWRLGLFVVWALLGGFVMSDSAAYWYYVRLIVELLVVVATLGAVLRNGGAPAPMWWAYIIVAQFNTIVVLLTGDVYLQGGIRDTIRQEGLTGNANALAFYCFLGILGAMAIVGETRRLVVRVVCAVSSLVSFLGMVLAGSRGAYLVFVLAITLWPIMCYSQARRNAWKTVAATLAVYAALYGAVQWIQTETRLGSRISVEAAMIEEAQRGSRLDLGQAAIRLIAQHPAIGVGVGQFSIASGVGWEAHNEWLEIAATTGIPGLVMFMSVYYSAWRRLTRAVAGLREPIAKYPGELCAPDLDNPRCSWRHLQAELHQHRHRVPDGHCRGGLLCRRT